MQSSDIPAAFQIPFASSAGPGFIRAIPKDAVTATSTDAPASLATGFPPETFTPLGSGGVPPSGADFNGILNQLSAWARWQAAGAAATYNSAFSTAIGGYPKGCVLASTTVGRLWQSIVENNTTDPDGGSASGWVTIAAAFGTDDSFYRLPNGKVEQWGYVASSSPSEPVVGVSLVTPMANASYNISITPSVDFSKTRADSWVQVIRGTKTTTGFSVQYQNPASRSNDPLDGFEWRVVGVGA